MKTQVLNSSTIGQPRLEHYSAASGEMEVTVVAGFPFTIGRSETADLPIDSARVSRDHALISRDGSGYRVQDLGSTNGTFINGQRVEEAPLRDGDLLVVANEEFTFSSGQAASSRDTATQPMGLTDVTGPEGEEDWRDLLRGIRQLQEMLSQRSIEPLFQPIVTLEQERVLGYEAFEQGVGQTSGNSQVGQFLLAMECRLTGHLRFLERLVAVEQATLLPADAYVFVKVDSSEMGDARLADSLRKLRDVMPGSQRLVVELPDVAMSNIPHCCEFRDRLGDSDIGIAYNGFAAGGEHLLGQLEIRPDFLKLHKSLVEGIQYVEKQRQQIDSIVRAGREIGCEVIAVGIRTREEADAVRATGCRYGQGDLFGLPRPISNIPPSGTGISGGTREPVTAPG